MNNFFLLYERIYNAYIRTTLLTYERLRRHHQCPCVCVRECVSAIVLYPRFLHYKLCQCTCGIWNIWHKSLHIIWDGFTGYTHTHAPNSNKKKKPKAETYSHLFYEMMVTIRRVRWLVIKYLNKETRLKVKRLSLTAILVYTHDETCGRHICARVQTHIAISKPADTEKPVAPK